MKESPMNRMKKLLGTTLLGAGMLGAPAHAALVETSPAELSPTASADPVADWLAATAGETSRAFALAAGPQPMTADLQATAAALGSSTLPTAASLSLWTFITTMRAQQQGDRFVALETSVALLRLGEGPVAPVPLPGALWLLVMGLLGMAGVRFTSPRKAGRAQTAPPEPALQQGLALAQA
jgi:hypothetical protein